MGFSKKVIAQGNGSGSNVTNDQWNDWNESQWNLLDITATKEANGKEVKIYQSIGITNFIMELGCLPQEDACMTSKLPVPAEGEDFSPEEKAEMDKNPSNYFTWQTKYVKGNKVQERCKHWPLQPEDQLVIAIDFPEFPVNYGAHPAADGVESIRPLRIDINGKWKDNFQRNITNKVNWKTNCFSDKDIKYKMTSAAGNLDEYKNDDHDLAHLVQSTCNWDIKMTKNVTDNGTYYSTEIRDPAAIQPIKMRNDVYTVEQQLEDRKCDVGFCGILLNGGDYPKENLEQVRDFWWSKAKLSVQFDKNEGTARDGEWLEGENWEDSDLCKAYLAQGIGKGNKPTGGSQGDAKPSPKQTPVEAKKTPPVKAPEPVDEFEDIPFAPMWLQYGKSSILSM